MLNENLAERQINIDSADKRFSAKLYLYNQGLEQWKLVLRGNEARSA